MAENVNPRLLNEEMQTTLRGLIGEYVFPNSQRVPAVTVGYAPPEGTFEPNSQNGGSLEVVIPATPVPTSRAISGNIVHREDCWEIVVINRGNDAGVLFQVYDRCTRRFRRCDVRSYLRKDTTSSYDYLKVILYFNTGHELYVPEAEPLEVQLDFSDPANSQYIALLQLPI